MAWGPRLAVILGALGVVLLLIVASARCLIPFETQEAASDSMVNSTQDLSIVEAAQASVVALADVRVRSMMAEGRYRVVRVEPRDGAEFDLIQPTSRLALVVLADGEGDGCVRAVVDLARTVVISAVPDIGHYGLGPWERVRAVELALQDDGVRKWLDDHPCRIGSVYDSSYSKASSCSSGRCAGVLIQVEEADSPTAVLAEVRLPYIYVQYDEREYPPGSLHDKLGTENSTYRDDLQKVGMPDGVELRATFEFYQFPRRGSYLYTQRYRFHENGRMDALVEIFGPGYGPSAHYDTVWLMRPYHSQFIQSSFEERRDGWRPVERAGRLAYEDYDVPEGTRQAVWRYEQGDRLVVIEPAPQDRAKMYVGVWDPAKAPGEGSTTPPSELVGDAPLRSSPLVFYYVSHQYANQDGCSPDRPCTTGPTLIVESKR